MKDGVSDKLQDFISDLSKDGVQCMIVGAEAKALDTICCDICRLKYLQEICMQASFDLLRKYQSYKERRDASSH